MKGSLKLVLGMTIAMITAPTLAAGTMGNSTVWSTTNGSPVVDGNGNPIRTIHYLKKAVRSTEQTPKTTSSLLEVIKKVVTKVLNEDLEPTSTLEKEVALAPTKEADVAVVVEDEPRPVEEAAATAVEDPVNVEYTFNDYLATILFDTNSADVSADGAGSLAQLAMATRQAESVLSVQLFGYTDSRGSHDYNIALSERRMLSVEEFLNGQSLTVTSRFAKGEAAPVVGDNGEDLALSRRVDVAIKTRHIKD